MYDTTIILCLWHVWDAIALSTTQIHAAHDMADMHRPFRLCIVDECTSMQSHLSESAISYVTCTSAVMRVPSNMPVPLLLTCTSPSMATTSQTSHNEHISMPYILFHNNPPAVDIAEVFLDGLCTGCVF